MSTIASALTKLPDEQREQLQVVFVTTDPARDTRAALRTYLDRFDPAFVGVTGPLDRIDALAKPMDIFIKKGQKLPSGGYEVDHSTVVVSVRKAAGDLVWTGATSPSDMAVDLAKILEEDA
jgi:protein SCO1/2